MHCCPLAAAPFTQSVCVGGVTSRRPPCAGRAQMDYCLLHWTQTVHSTREIDVASTLESIYEK